MIKSITVTNHLGESIKLELAFPEKSGFAVLGVEGLGPSKADINISELSTTDGAQYNSARVTSRNIVLSLGFMFAPTIEYVRHLSYKYFPVKKQIKLVIETDTRLCETYGYVESNEPDIFSVSSGTRISIVCPDPYLYSSGDNDKNVAVFFASDPMFEFDFENEGLYDQATNGVSNGDFSNGTNGWFAGSSTISALNNTITITGNGGGNYPLSRTDSIIPCVAGKKIYVCCKAKATNSVCNYVNVRINGTTAGSDVTAGIQNAPTSGVQYNLSGIVTLTDQTGFVRVILRSGYVDAATANGQKMEVQEVMAIDLTAIFGAGNEPSKATCDAMFATWFDGTISGNNIEFANVTTVQEQTIIYDGDSEVGVSIIMHALGPVSNVTIHNTQTLESMTFDTDRLAALTGSGLVSGDTLTISTVKGAKSATLLRGGNNINVLNCIAKDANWFQLSQGDNIFAYEAESGFTNLEFRIENMKVYEGV